ncbi:GNAT family N-acetyltransferase [Streptomyces sp. WAC06614]|uniref:GNAT family N-acetyltransferase n=1 Tax=Streptomyces sp. WAC06614 TaxID=2487416 RepID=UPI000F7B6118|nr:GNAT family N-acetyltransferase [Streptomyces sp. WAC06614]RSS54605.1 N-acetyltransferase [Streptomyces sp. WAC06614]
MTQIRCRRFVRAEGEALVDFLSGDTWPFHGSRTVDPEQVRRGLADGVYEGEESRTFWVLVGDDVVGLVRLMDLGDPTPVLDLRIRTPWRGRGIGRQALEWATRYLFEEFPRVRRIEGTTRQDNVAMRRTFLRCGYVKEAHYRQGWPGADGTVHDAVGYAVLRGDREAGTVTAVPWDDEELVRGDRGATGAGGVSAPARP